jgi:DNA-binding CsgD family transcriptional regulator
MPLLSKYASINPKLSDAQRDVVQMLYDGYTTDMIVKERGWSKGAVYSYVRHICKKTGLGSRGELVLWWFYRREIAHENVDGQARDNVPSTSAG